MALTKMEVETRMFDGFSRVIFFPSFDVNTLSLSTTLAQILANGKDLGQIVEGSESWDGDDIEINTLKNTEGGAIRSKKTPGTCAWSCRIPHSKETAALVGGKTINETSLGTDFTKADSGNVIGINPKDMMFDCPIGVLNLDRNELALFPNGSAAFALTIEDDGLMEYNVKASANDIDTDTLSTMMFIPLKEDPLNPASSGS